jgi:2-polyprenyl-6-methoxyphenol hydroxylase-like FAD-dependent oxidoreductase
MSVYRTAFPAKLAFADEAVRERWGGKHTYEFWMGSGMHIGLYLSPELAAFGITPRDHLLAKDKVARESWDPDVSPDEVIDVLRRAKVPGESDSDWHPVLEALVRTAPPSSIIHWPLRWRNLRREWVSPGGRVVQIGDSAHSTVPSSAAGGTLALEDAITLATSLQIASSPAAASAPGAGVPLGTRVYNLLRYERASCTQKMAFVNAQVLGDTTDWDAVKADPSKVRVRYPRWLFRHDPEGYVYEKYGQAFAHLVNGAEFHNTNIPPGHQFVHWTLEGIHREMAAGKKVEDLLDGDWT